MVERLRLYEKALEIPNGMILTSGPTGSGKSTSLYALIQEIKNDSINIVTLEDPVEYKMSGINQIQVNPQVGLNFCYWTEVNFAPRPRRSDGRGDSRQRNSPAGCSGGIDRPFGILATLAH